MNPVSVTRVDPSFRKATSKSGSPPKKESCRIPSPSWSSGILTARSCPLKTCWFHATWDSGTLAAQNSASCHQEASHVRVAHRPRQSNRVEQEPSSSLDIQPFSISKMLYSLCLHFPSLFLYKVTHDAFKSRLH